MIMRKSIFAGLATLGMTAVWLTLSSASALAAKPLSEAHPATVVSPRVALLNGTVDPNGVETTYHFVYGATASYGSRVPATEVPIGAAEANIAVLQTIEGLAPGTTYHFAVVASSSEGSSQSADRTFTTPEALLPLVATGAASEVSQNGATISGSVNSRGVRTTYEFDLGTDTTYGTRVFGEANSLTEPVSFTLSLLGLASGTTYHYRIVANDTYGTSYGADLSFTTSTFPTASILAPQGAPLIPAPAFEPPSTSDATTPKATHKTKKSKRKRGRKAGKAAHRHGKRRGKR
jgi:hypothetical protein